MVDVHTPPTITMSFVRKAIKAFRDPALPENYFRLQVNILRALGLEMLKEETWAYTIYSRLFLFVIAYSFTFFESFELYYQRNNLNAVIEVISYWFTHVGGVVKVTLLFYKRKQFGKMMTLFHSVPFAPDKTRGGKTEEDYVRQTVRSTEIQDCVYLAFVLMTLLAGGMRCVWNRIFAERENWLLPFSPIAVVKEATSPFFEIGSFYQFSCVTLFAFVIVNVDVLICSIMAQLSVQFKILDNAFKNIRTRAEEMRDNDQHGRDEKECLKILIGKYINHHCEVFQLADDLEELMNLIVLGATSIDTVLLCFLLYTCSQEPIGSISFFQNFFYYWIIVCQVSMYCYWGNEVTIEAENISLAAGFVDWSGTYLSIPKGLVMVIARSQKPLYMTIGKFFPLSMTTLMSLLKGSFSYYTVMRQTSSKK